MYIQNLTSSLIFSVQDGIATLTLNRPQTLNAVNQEMIDGMFQVADEIDNSEAIKALIITGAGRGFCSGADLTWLASLRQEAAQKTYKQWVEPIGTIASRLYGIRVPVIGAINGVAVGAGLSLALLCDIRVASRQARLGPIWVKRGLIPDWGGTWFMPRIMGLDKALLQAFTGDLFNAEEAEQMGLVTKTVPQDDLMRVTNEIATKIARGPSIAIELMKRGMRRALSQDLDAQLDFETYAQNLCIQTQDCSEAMAAVKEGRNPNFQGK